MAVVDVTPYSAVEERAHALARRLNVLHRPNVRSSIDLVELTSGMIAELSQMIRTALEAKGAVSDLAAYIEYDPDTNAPLPFPITFCAEHAREASTLADTVHIHRPVRATVTPDPVCLRCLELVVEAIRL